MSGAHGMDGPISSFPYRKPSCPQQVVSAVERRILDELS
jgi:hypothetical protein